MHREVESMLIADEMEYRVINFSTSPIFVENALTGEKKKGIHLAPGEKSNLSFDKELFTLSFNYKTRGDVNYRIKNNVVVFY